MIGIHLQSCPGVGFRVRSQSCILKHSMALKGELLTLVGAEMIPDLGRPWPSTTIGA